MPKLENTLAEDWKQSLEEELNRNRPLMVKSTSNKDLQELVTKAHEGQIEKVFIDTKDYIWGEYNEAKHKTEIHQKHRWESEDLLNEIAVETLKNGGEAYPLPKEYKEKDYSAVATTY